MNNQPGFEKYEDQIRLMSAHEVEDLKLAAQFRYMADKESKGYPDGRDFAILCLIKTLANV